MSKIGVVGAGYVGLVTGACFADLGNDVTCIDVDANRIRVGLLRRRRSADQGCDEERSHDQNRNETPAPNVTTFAR